MYLLFAAAIDGKLEVRTYSSPPLESGNNSPAPLRIRRSHLSHSLCMHCPLRQSNSQTAISSGISPTTCRFTNCPSRWSGFPVAGQSSDINDTLTELIHGATGEGSIASERIHRLPVVMDDPAEGRRSYGSGRQNNRMTLLSHLSCHRNRRPRQTSPLVLLAVNGQSHRLWTKPNSLVDSFVAVLKHALTNYHHGCIEPEEAKALPITAFIQPRSSATSCRSSRNSFLPMPDAPHSEARPVPLLHLCLPETSIGVPCACRPRPQTPTVGAYRPTFWSAAQCAARKLSAVSFQLSARGRSPFRPVWRALGRNRRGAQRFSGLVIQRPRAG